MTLRRYCLWGVFRFYPLQSLQPCMPSYHNRYRKAKWCSVKIPTDIVATNTSGHSHTPVPRQHKNEWINWRKRVSAANSQVTMTAVLSSSATLPKRKHYLKRSVRRLLLLIRRGKRSRCRLRKILNILSRCNCVEKDIIKPTIYPLIVFLNV